MKISIIGLGYVGLVSAVCLKKLGHRVIGVDIDEEKVAKLKLHNNPLKNVEKLDEYIKKYKVEFYFYDHSKAILNSDISFICVETPTKKSGQLDLKPLKKVCRSIGKILKNKKYHILVVRSTIFPGSLNILKKEIEKYSRKKCGKDFDLVINPEFLREDTAIDDFFNPSFVIVGSSKKEVGEKVMSIYDKINTKKFIVDKGIGQMIKYLNNSWHGLKVSYTNEIAAICKKLDIDSKELMKIFVQDTKLNISPYYHIPGEAFGGHCLPKDTRVLETKAKNLGIKCPIIESILKSNKIQEEKDKK